MIVDFTLAYFACLICLVVVMRAARDRNRAEQDADAERDTDRRTR